MLEKFLWTLDACFLAHTLKTGRLSVKKDVIMFWGGLNHLEEEAKWAIRTLRQKMQLESLAFERVCGHEILS